MSIYIDQIRQLVELQKVDDLIFEVKKELELAPKEVEKLEESFHQHEVQRQKLIDRLDHLKDQAKKLSLDLDDDTAKIKKSKTKLMQVETSREYQAMMREMDNMEKLNKNRADECTALEEELNLQKENFAEVDEAYNKLNEKLVQKKANLQARVDEANINLIALEKQRKNSCGFVPEPVLARYEFIRKRLEHPVIVSVAEGVCSGCHISIPPQAYIELQRGQQILSCPNCQRLVFWNEHFSVAGKLDEQELEEVKE